MAKFTNRLFFAALLVAVQICGVWFQPALAQIQVTLQPTRNAFVIHEPLLVNLTLTNLAGREIMLEDTPGQPWLDFRISNQITSRPATRRSSSSTIAPPIVIPPGATVRRSFDLNRYFLLEEMGTTIITAEVRFAAINRSFISNRVPIEITDGRILWSQTLGLPGTPDIRRLALLTARLNNKSLAFLRVTNPETYAVYMTRPLGEIILLAEPQAQIDASNNLHLVFMTAPKVYLHYTFSSSGEQLDRVVYQATQTRPMLLRDASGNVAVAGGLAIIPKATLSAEEQVLNAPAKLSARPPGLPNSVTK